MGIFDRFRANTRNNVEVTSGLLEAILNGQSVSRDNIMSLPIINSCVDLISNAFASIPIKLYHEIVDENGKKKVEEIIDDRYKMLNEETDDVLDYFQMRKSICEDYLLDKGGYLYIDKTPNRFKSLYYIKPSQVGISFDDSDPLIKTAEFIVGAKTYDESDFIKLLRNTKNGFEGVGLNTQIQTALNTAVERMKYDYSLARTGGSRKGFLLSEKKLSKEAMEQLKSDWANYYAGNANTVILNEGMTFKEASNTSRENEITSKNQAFVEDIKNLFHISKDYGRFIDDAVIPIMNAFIAQLNKLLLLEKEKELGFYFAPDTKEIRRGSITERTTFYKEAIASGWMNRNEVRYLEDMNQVKGLDLYSASLGQVLIDGKTGQIYTPNTNEKVKLEDMPLSQGTGINENGGIN